ncbi:hypothetical protein ACFXPS_38440 [Nocardia sp. NPDC059091]|uniref:hypothetical protein n=1 Tax=unclassified Nocardia TaxID=2637762 RepID=UPI0036AE5197
MDDEERDALVRKHFEEYGGVIGAGERAKAARLRLLRKLRDADPEHYTQARLADLSGMSQQNVSYLVSKPAVS